MLTKSKRQILNVYQYLHSQNQRPLMEKKSPELGGEMSSSLMKKASVLWDETLWELVAQ